MHSKHRPDWANGNDKPGFAVSVIPGIENSYLNNKNIQLNNSKKYKNIKSSLLNTEKYIEGILNGDRSILAKAITLIESNLADHKIISQKILNTILPDTGKSIRIGVTGAPGAGKSTFIDVFGSYLCSIGHKIAVLTVDPSSSLSKGSILGDKTRMDNLANNPHAFIRPSPSGGNLGGVAKKTRESMLLCEAAGFDVIIVETVGVGQSEIAVRSMVDLFILLLMPGEGDELQGIKKGSVELSDLVLINKADGDNIARALATQQEYKQAVHYIMNATENWTTKVLTCSAINSIGIPEVWDEIKNFEKTSKDTSIFNNRRQNQLIEWMESLVNDAIKDLFYNSNGINESLIELKSLVLQNKITPAFAAEKLLTLFRVGNNENTNSK